MTKANKELQLKVADDLHAPVKAGASEKKNELIKTFSSLLAALLGVIVSLLSAGAIGQVTKLTTHELLLPITTAGLATLLTGLITLLYTRHQRGSKVASLKDQISLAYAQALESSEFNPAQPGK